MMLSDQQMAAVRHGIPGKVQPSFTMVDLPVGLQPLPAWVKGLHVDFMDGYGNAPSYTLLVEGNARSWPNKRFAKEGERYMAQSGDGRAEIYYHNGAIRSDKVRRFKDVDGRLHEWAPTKPSPHADGVYRTGDKTVVDGEWVDVEKLCTTKQEGFGGSGFEITLIDGREVVLRGPWHGGAPDGWVETAYMDRLSTYYSGKRRDARSVANAKVQRAAGHHGWGTCTGGLFVEANLFIRVFARFAPHLQLAWVDDGYGLRLQALKPEWSAPKRWIQAEDRRQKLIGALRVLAIADTVTTDAAPAWALNELSFQGTGACGFAERLPGGDWRNPTYRITDKGRDHLSEGLVTPPFPVAAKGGPPTNPTRGAR